MNQGFKPLFGSSNTFGSQQPQGGSAFGSSGSMFGQPQTSGGGGGLFGSSTGGGFGSTSGGGGLFGQSKPAIGFGAPTQSAFGSSSMGGGSIFGGGSSMGGGTGFGGTGTDTSLMSTGSGGSAFGQPSGGFGAPASGSPFGQPSGSSSFGLSSAKGTAHTKYQVTTEYDSTHNQPPLKFQSISLMPAYKNKSVEELRLEDYAMGNKRGPGDASAGGGGLFSSPSTQQGGGLFGKPQQSTGGLWGGQSPASQSAFGSAQQTSSIFGGSSTGGSIFGGGASTGSAFGSTNMNANKNVFGKPASTGFGSTPQSSGSSLFGGTSFGSTFGGASQSTPAPGASSGGLFGQSSTPAFGASTGSAPAIGASTGGSLFGGGSSLTPTQPTLGGGTSFSAPSTGSFSFSNTGAQSATKAFSTPSFSTPGQVSGGLGGGGLFSSQSASPGLTSSGFTLGGTPSTAAPSTSLFNTTPAATTTQPLQANIASTPYGTYPLFTQTVGIPAQPGGVQLAAASVGSAIGSTAAASSSTTASPSLYRRTPRSTAKVRPRSFIPRTGTLGSGSSVSSLFGSTSGTPTFTSNLFMNGNEDSPWKSLQKSGDERASSVKKLVIEPLAQTPARSVSRTLALSEGRNGPEFMTPPNGHRPTNTSTPNKEDGRPSSSQHTSTKEKKQNGSSEPMHGGIESITYRPTPKRSNDSSRTQNAVRNGPSVLGSDSNKNTNGGNGSAQSPEDGAVATEAKNEDPPILTKRDYYTIPAIHELRKMEEEELKSVENFTVGREGIGEVVWNGRTDVRGVDLDTTVHFSPKVVVVYPDEAEKPPVGQKLNKPAKVSLQGVYKVDKRTKEPMKDADSVAAMEAKLRKHCKSEGLNFIGYDGAKGVWTFAVQHF